MAILGADYPCLVMESQCSSAADFRGVIGVSDAD